MTAPHRLFHRDAAPRFGPDRGDSGTRNPVIIRLSDFKSNEYAVLLGGTLYGARRGKPDDRGCVARRAITRSFYERAFALECHAIRRLRGKMGFDNAVVMVPLLSLARRGRPRVAEVMARYGLERRPRMACSFTS